MKKTWLLIPVGIIIFLCLGTVYSWSVFRGPLEIYYDIDANLSGLPYMFFLACYALFMPISSGFLQKYGPKIMIAIGGILVGVGWVLSAFAPNIFVFTLTYGVMAGSGVGIVYGAPIAAVTKWFPEKKGLLVGLILLGFGLSPFITAPLSEFLIEQHGVMEAFKTLGITFIIIVPLLGLLINFPIEDKNNQANVNNKGLLKELLKKRKFIGLWLCFTLGTLVGLMMIGITSIIGVELIKLTPSQSAIYISLFSVFNGVGRPLFGWLTDKYTPKKASLISYSLITLAAVLMLFAKEGAIGLFVIAFCIFWLNLGGWLAIAPTSTAIFFGQNNYSKNYGYIFTAYGVGAIIGTLISGEIRTIFGSYELIFPVIIGVSLIGMVISSLYLKNDKKA